MNRFKLLIILLFISTAGYSQLYINEFMASNTNTIVDPDYKQSADWIELYNAGSSTVILDGYFLTDNLKKPDKWKIIKMTLAPKGFAIFWADNRDSANHTSFALSASGEQIGLSDQSGALIDSVVYGVQNTDLSNYGAGSITVLDSTLLGVPDPNISMGRKPDGSNDWVLFTKPTPGASNATVGYKDVVKSDPGFSPSGGVYHSSVSLKINSIFGGDVRYTLDGTEPNEQSTIASAPINISKNTVVRARIHKSGQIMGPVTTNTYLIDNENKINKLPIVCVTSDPVNFWDPVKGIYVVHSVKPDWEIPINIELFENDGRTGDAFNLKGGVKSTGLYSWQLPEKMMGVNFRKEYGVSKLDYPLIFDKPRKVYRTFSLRASGSDWGNTMFRDGMIQSAAVENTSLDNSGFRASVVYINGQYMGIHNIREKIDEDYIVGNHGLAAGTFDMIEETDAGHYAETGDFKQNDYFLSLTAKDLSSQANYDAVAAQMDITEFTEMVSTEVYSGNSSIGHNLMKWKSKDSGKWKWILMDFDRGFFGANNQMISFYLNEDGWPFKDLMKNTDYKKLFGRKLSDLLFTSFNPVRMISEIDDHQKRIEAEMPNHVARWAGTHGTGNYSSVYAISSVDYWLSEVEKLRTFAQARPGIILNDLTNYGFQSPVAVSVTTFPAKAGKLTFNGLKIPVDVCSGGYPKGEQIKLTAEAKAGFNFKGWKTNGDSILIDKEQIWKYSDTGTDLKNTWIVTNFSDTSWKSGQAELGYGDGDEKTVISYGSDVNNKQITSYFRKGFLLKNKQNVSGLTILLKCDDGAVVYLNGKEIQRFNMPAGTIGFGTLASTSISGADESVFHTFTIGTESLLAGTNVVAVEVHQNAANSSDISFDMELSATMNGVGNYLSTAKELVVNPQSALSLTAVFEGDGKCKLPAEITTALTLSKSCSPYIVPENVNITSTGKLTIEPGVEIWLSDGVSISSLGPIKAIGTRKEPVIFKSNPESAKKKWGNISIKDTKDTIWFRNVIIENASEGPNPVRDIAALAVSNSTVMLDSISVVDVYKNPINVYNCQTKITNSRIHSDYAGCDEINIKRGKILIDKCEFIGNTGLDSDALDFGEMSEGSVVRNSYFHDMDGFNADAVDLGDHAKNVIIDGIVVYNFQDKGVSIGQQSSAKITNSVFINCGMGAGMKDSSTVKIDHCTYYGNFYALANYQKHPGDAGSNLVVTNSILSNSYELGYFSDEFSALSISNSSDDTEKLPDGKNNLNVNPLFTNPAIYDFNLLSGSALFGAGSDGKTLGANLKLPSIPLSVMISDIAYVTDAGAEDLEFIGLYNPGTSAVSMDSCSFASGFTYTFPQGVSIRSKEKIYLTNNSASSFWNAHGGPVYQWESGRLADEGEKIQLVNKYGKVIDQVIYNNVAPWPVPQNSQQGISLTRYDVDNHFGEYWSIVPIDKIVGVPTILSNKSVTVYPNPGNDKVRITFIGQSNLSGEVYSSTGQLKKQFRLDQNGGTTVDVSTWSNGIYLLKLGTVTEKVLINR